MKTRVLLPLDGSTFSEQIIPHVCRICQPSNTEIILLRIGETIYSHTAAQAEIVRDAYAYGMPTRHVSAYDMEAAKHPIYATQIEMNERAEMEAAMIPVAQTLRNTGFEVSHAVEFGEPANMITHFAERERIDLIAMTTHSRTGIRRALLGSVAEEVIHRVQIPVLLFHPQEAGV